MPLTTGVYVTVNVSSPVFVAASWAVTVITLLPLDRPIDDTLHDVVPVAVPLVGVHVGHAHVTLETPVSSEAVPARVVRGVVDVEYVALLVGAVIVAVGAVVSPPPEPNVTVYPVFLTPLASVTKT